MAKKIFKVLGIVLGSTIGLVSVIFGTLAILGKFKTPIVYPNRLYFESDQKIIVSEKDESGLPSEIYSFVLKADGEIDGQGVNQKDCLLTVSSNLITICDKDGNKVEQDANKRYKIKCNEETYFKLNVLPLDNQNSSVTLSAITNHSGTPKVADNTMTIMVDQKIDSFEIVSTNSTILTSDNKTTQYITIGTGDKLPIQYITNPEISQQPINSKSAKLFDLYFDRSTAFDKTNLTDISLVNAETLNSQDTKYDDIKSMFEIDSGILTFKAIQPGTYKFKVLVFDTYENRENFDNNLLNSENFVGKNNQEIINELLSQSETGAIINDVEIVVKDVFVNSVVMENTIVSLPLFGEKIVSMADLGITMDVGANDPSSRFTSAKFGAFSDDDFSDAIPEFINDNGDKIYWGKYTENGSEKTGFYSYSANGEQQSATTSVSGSTFKINDTYQMVDHITVNSEEYYCNNGLAVVDSSNSIKLLNEGTYVSFYTLNGSTLELYSNENISVDDLGGIGAERKWKFTANTNVDGLKIGVLVVNKGKTILNDNFKCNANVTIFEETFAINYTDKIKNANFAQTLYYSIDQNGEGKYSAINVSDLIAPTGSYNKCVLVVESDNNKNITTLGEDYKFTKDGKTYEIVGYFDNGVFQNVLKFNGTGSDNVDEVYVAQLCSDGENLELTDLLEKIKTPDAGKTAANYVKSIDTQKISVNTVCQIDSSLLEFKINDNEISESNPLYEQSNAQLKITSTNSNFAKICKFYGFENEITGSVILKKFFTSEATINSAKYDDANVLIITFTTPTLSKESETISIKIKGFVSTEKEVSVSVLSSQPDSVVFKYRDGENTLTYTLKDNIDDATAKSNKNSLVITALFNGSVYEYSYKFVDSNGDGHECENSPFNTEILSGGLYFQADEFKSVAYQINYGSGDTSIFNATDLTDMDSCVLKAGETYLSVQIGEKIGYLKLKVETNLSVDTSDLSVSQDGEISASITSGQSLKDIYPIKYNGSTDFISKDYTSLSNFVVSYGGGELTFDDTDYFVWENGNGETILEISFDANGWTFTRKTDLYGQLEISFDVTTKLETRRINLTFTSDIVAKTNYASWGKDLKIYAGTTVQLVESYFDSASTQAVFLIEKTTGNAENVKVYNGTEQIEKIWTPTDTGTYTIKITTADGGIIIERDVKVVPNVIVTNTTAEITCDQGISDAINAFNLYSMPTGFTYGSTKNSENNIILYSNQTLGKISDTESLNLGIYDKDNTSMTSIPWVEAIGEIEEKTVTLKSGDNIIESDLTLKILNPYAIEFKETEIVANKTDITSIYTLYKQKIVSSDNFGTLKDSLYIYNSEDGKYESVSGDFSATTKYYEKITLTYNGADINDSTGNNIQTLNADTKILNNVLNIYENAQLIILFKIDGKDDNVATTEINESQLKATATVKISPWTPERTTQNDSTDIKFATAGSNFNLIDDVFNVEDISNISSLKAKGIYDNDGNGITDIYCSGFSVSGIDGGVNAGCVVAMNNIRGASTTVYVEYDLIYLGQTEPYTFRVPLTIKNQTEIVITRPTGNEYKLATANISLQYNDESNETQTFVNNNSVYYEPIAVSTSKGLSIDVLDNSYLGVQRIGTTDGAIESLTLVAYQSGNAAFTTYAGAISVSGSEIIFPQASMRGMTGYVIFKVETQSRNYDFLTFYIYSISSTDTSTSAVDPTKNINVKVDTTKTISSILGTSGATISGVDGEGNATSLAVVDLSKVEVYVVDEKCETNTDSTQTDSTQFTKYTKLDMNTEISQPNNYVTIKLVLVYNNGGNARYALGTVTLYLTPSVYVTKTENQTGVTISPEISTTTGLTTGVFTGTIENTVTSVDCPFTLSSGTISSVELYKANSTEDDIVKNVEILDVLKDTSKYAISTDLNEMFNITTDETTEKPTTITINKKTTSDYTFWAKYTSGDLVLWVKYTLKETTINADSSFTVGSFDTNGFVDTISLNDILGYESSDLTIELKDPQGETQTIRISKSSTSLTGDLGVTYNSGELKFTLNENAQTITAKFTLNDVVDGNGSVERNYTFHVRPAYEIIVSTNNEGNSASTPVSTTKIGAETLYTSNIGSTLTIQESVYPKGATGENIKYYIYTIGGINVYTKSEMSITGVSDTNKFVIASGGNVVNDYTINFAHNAIHDTADIEKITLTFTSTYDSIVYTTKEIYVNVIPTYARIEAVYLNDGADHENVLGGDKFSVNNLLTAISDRYRVKLIGTDNSKKGLDLSEMGFMTSGNPNKITISNASANATVNADKDTITFDSASAENKDAKVTFSYNGLTFDYNFKIMASKYNDNLDPFIVEMSEDYGISNNTSVSIVNASATSSTSNDGYVYIGQLGDNDGNLFTITSPVIKNTNSTSTIYREDEEITGENPLLITSNVGDITIYEGVKYTITANDCTHNIVFDATNHKLYARIVDFQGGNTEPINSTSFSVTATGTTSKIMNDFTFNFLNVTITENYTSSSKVVYGGGYLELFTKVEGENVDTNYLFNSNSDLTFEIDQGKSTYNVGGTGDIELSNDPYGNLVDLSGNRLTFAEVGEETTITLALTAKLGSTNIKTVYAKIKIIPNLQFIMNGDAYSGGGTTQSFETDLVLKTNNMNAFKDSASGVAGITVNFVNTKDANNSSNGKFTELVYNLYDLSGNDLGTISNIKIEAKPGAENENIIISNSSITFKDDYNGYVYLIVSYLTDYGTYSVNWTIHVTPILQLEYASSNQIVSGASGSIKSGETISILSDVVDTTLAVKATLPDVFTSISLDDSKTDVSVTANYKTFIASEENRTSEKKELYENETQTTYGSGSSGLTHTGNVWTTTLPAVPVSAIGNANNYYVVYQISISYLGKTVDKYVAYYAYNESSVTAYNYTSGDDGNTYSSASVNVDKITDNFLPLFTKSTSAKDGTQVFTHEYSSENNDYNDFIGSINAVKIVNQDGTVFYFALEEKTISNTTYDGIYLTKAFDSESDVTDSTKAKTKSLFTNKLEGVLSCMLKGAEIVSLSGFELTTSSTIESQATTTYTLENIFGSARVPSNLDKTTEILAITNISTLGEEDADGKLITASTNATLLGYVKNANKITKFKEISTITGDYKLYSITYSGSSDSQIYSISKSFYVVYSSTGDVSIVDYPTNKKSFVVQYVGNASIDLSNAVRYFKMNNNVIEKVEIISNISTDIDIDDNKIRIEKVNDTTYTGKITIYESELQDYKNNNPTATTYQGGPITFNVIIDGNEFKVAVEFRLPSTTTS